MKDYAKQKRRLKRRSFFFIGVSFLLVIIFIGPLVAPIPRLSGTVPPWELADSDSLFLELAGTRVHYKITGAGDPVMILLHGFGASVFSWREVMKPLGRYGTVLAYDRPAFGPTERRLSWDDGANPYAPSSQVNLLLDLMDNLDVDRAIIIGNSAGGTVAVQAALAHADRIQGLVLVDAAIYEGGGAPRWVRPLLSIPQVNRLGPLITRRIASWGEEFLESAWHDPEKITPEIRAGYREPLRAEHWDRALWELTKASRAPDLVGELDTLMLPSLVISGSDDRIVPVESSVRLAGELPNAELVVIPNCGHVPQEECPEAFLSAVEEFLSGIGLDASAKKVARGAR